MIMGYLGRIIFVVLFGLACFVPNYGLFWLLLGVFPTSPFAAIVGLLFLGFIMVGVLPLSARWFVGLTTGIIAIVGSIGLYKGFEMRLPLFEAGNMYIWLIVLICVVLGWMMVSKPIYRQIKGIVPVENQGEDHAN